MVDPRPAQGPAHFQPHEKGVTMRVSISPMRLLCTAAAAAVLLFSPVGAYAEEASAPAVERPSAKPNARRANIEDTRYRFNMNSHGNTALTGYRRKDNASSVFLSVDACGGNPRMFVDGAWSYSGGGKQDCTVGTYRARYTGYWRIMTHVNERGLSYARLTSWAESGTAFVRGLWSPDSSRWHALMGD